MWLVFALALGIGVYLTTVSGPVILLIGWMVAGALAGIVANLLRAVRFNELAQRSGFSGFVQNMGVRTDASGVTSSYANTINTAGQTVGSADKYVGGTYKGGRAVRWDAVGGALELGNLGTDASGFTTTQVYSINTAGQTAGYAEKYGPTERYNYLRFVGGVPCPVLVTLGAIEMENNMAFRGAADALAEVRGKATLTVEVIPQADHFYSNARPELLARVEAWLPSHTN